MSEKEEEEGYKNQTKKTQIKATFYTLDLDDMKNNHMSRFQHLSAAASRARGGGSTALKTERIKQDRRRRNSALCPCR